MNIDSETSKKIQELQIFEQNLQNFHIQKQALQVELNEINNALVELKNSDSDVYKITGSIMLKSDKESLSKDLEEKKKLFDLRISTMEKQEKILDEKASDLKEEINKSIGQKKE